MSTNKDTRTKQDRSLSSSQSELIAHIKEDLVIVNELIAIPVDRMPVGEYVWKTWTQELADHCRDLLNLLEGE